MKKLLLKLLGLDTLVAEHKYLKETLDNVEGKYKDLCMAQEGLSAKVDEVTEKVDKIEIPDFDADDFVREDDVNDRIESYLNDNDYASQSYVDDEIESKVEDAVESAVEAIDLTEKVKEVVDDMDKASFGDTEEMEGIVRKEVKSFMLNSVKIDFIVR